MGAKSGDPLVYYCKYILFFQAACLRRRASVKPTVGQIELLDALWVNGYIISEAVVWAESQGCIFAEEVFI